MSNYSLPSCYRLVTMETRLGQPKRCRIVDDSQVFIDTKVPDVKIPLFNCFCCCPFILIDMNKVIGLVNFISFTYRVLKCCIINYTRILIV